MLEELLADAKRRMAKSVDSTKHEFATVRTGRASTALLDRIQVDYYGTKTPLNQLAIDHRARRAHARRDAVRQVRR